MAGPQYDFDAIKQLATKWGSEWDTKSTTALGNIRAGRLEGDAFSEAASARAFGALYSEAHSVYLATIEGVKKDLADFQEKLRLAANAMETRDGNAAEVMQTLAARWTSEEGFHSRSEYDRKRDELARENAGKPQDGAVPASAQDGNSQDGSGQGGAGQGGNGGGAAATDGSGSQLYGATPDPGATPPDDGDTSTDTYASNQNPYAANKPTT